jgi:hypothetical protein
MDWCLQLAVGLAEEVTLPAEAALDKGDDGIE